MEGSDADDTENLARRTAAAQQPPSPKGGLAVVTPLSVACNRLGRVEGDEEELSKIVAAEERESKRLELDSARLEIEKEGIQARKDELSLRREQQALTKLEA